jgi:hypothetical protein
MSAQDWFAGLNESLGMKPTPSKEGPPGMVIHDQVMIDLDDSLQAYEFDSAMPTFSEPSPHSSLDPRYPGDGLPKIPIHNFPGNLDEFQAHSGADDQLMNAPGKRTNLDLDPMVGL